MTKNNHIVSCLIFDSYILVSGTQTLVPIEKLTIGIFFVSNQNEIFATCREVVAVFELSVRSGQK